MSYATFKTIFPQSIYAKQKDRESNQMTMTGLGYKKNSDQEVF